ncbi:hypothetical protein XH93_08755 [Bradyrhizobium sp. CCBAU 51753]|nr:hypothetical protein XH93_08755 [Bradyrhizobium sp. CCBAU 51753]
MLHTFLLASPLRLLDKTAVMIVEFDDRLGNNTVRPNARKASCAPAQNHLGHACVRPHFVSRYVRFELHADQRSEEMCMTVIAIISAYGRLFDEFVL